MFVYVFINTKLICSTVHTDIYYVNNKLLYRMQLITIKSFDSPRLKTCIIDKYSNKKFFTTKLLVHFVIF